MISRNVQLALVALGGGVLLAGIGIYISRSSTCESTLVAEFPSPDRVWRAQLMTERCEYRRPKSVVYLSSGRGSYRVSDTPSSVSEIGLLWVGPRDLQVSYPGADSSTHYADAPSGPSGGDFPKVKFRNAP